MPDDIMTELWEIKDSIAREHGYDIDALVADLRSKERPAEESVVDLGAMRKTTDQYAPAEADKTRA